MKFLDYCDVDHDSKIVIYEFFDYVVGSQHP